MKRLISLALASVSVAAIAPVANAGAAPQSLTTASEPAEEATLGEIVVTARRRAESLQEVPQTVNAVTGDTLQKLNIKRFEDVQTVVPGLSLASNNSGFAAAASLRGVTFDVTTGAQPTVALYMNDAPVQALFLFQSLFDIGQIEVLKGPQGTTRGVSAPSGAITVTMRKPSLSDFGGYVDVTATDLHGRNAQGAINLPIVKDVLAVRAAAVIEQNDFDGVRSIHNPLRPTQKTSAERLGLSFEPSDVFDANVTYQHMDRNYQNFTQISGPGPGAFSNAGGSFPASYDPPISPEDRLSVNDQPSIIRQHFDVVIAQVDSRVFGQHLSYVGSYQHQKLQINSANDNGDLIPFGDLINSQVTTGEQTTQEIRLASDPAPGRFFDYTVGAFYNWVENGGHVTQTASLLPGAFGLAPGVNFEAFNQNYRVPVLIDIPGTLQETSLFGSVTFHLGANTELSGGVRHIWSITDNATVINVGDGLLNLGAIGLPTTLPCSILNGTAGPNPGDCFLNTAQLAGDNASRSSEAPNIYNVSLSHHFTRDFLVYANTGTSYRPPVSSVGLQGAIVSSPLPVLHNLTFHPSERSRAYEVGFKSTWLDGRARLNASVFRQRFTNLTIFLPGVNYFNTVTNAATASFGMTASVDALVQGFDVDTAFQVTPEWNISAQMSYADGKVKGSQVPCNTFAADGTTSTFNTADPATGVAVVSLCPGGPASRLPLWNATFTSEYVHPLSDQADGFFRVLATYYPENKNRAEPDFTAPNYSLVNLYLGLRSHDGAWEASIFARNAFKAEQAVDIQQTQQNLNGPLGSAFAGLIHPSGYYLTQTTPRREVGVNVHYAFGSR
jgi:iron complex outermembrane receptor protein